MFSFLLKPYPYNFSLRKIALNAFISYVIVFFILFFIQPFKINQLSTFQALKISFYYASVCPIVIYFIELSLPLLFKRFYSEKNWTVLKNIIHVLIIVSFISIGNSLISYLLFNVDFNLKNILKFLYPTLAIGVFPISISVIITQYKKQKEYNQLATKINKELIEQLKAITSNSFSINKQLDINTINIVTEKENDLIAQIYIGGQNSSEGIKLLATNLVYCCSSDNYVDVFYIDNKKLTRKTQRNTLKNIELITSKFSFLLKCHRSYIVNLNFIEKVIGNAQGLKLKLKNVEEEITVSRQLTKKVQQFIENK